MKRYSKNYYITPHLLVTRDEPAIVDFLIDHDEMPHDFEKTCVSSFFVGKDFHLVLYFPQIDDRGFQMFVVEDFSIHVRELFILKELFAQLIRHGSNTTLMKKAHYRVDSIIQMAHTFRALLHHEETSLPGEDYLPGSFSIS